jgi:hypothetical protein
MDDREGALLVGSLLTLGFLLVLGVIKIGTSPSAVGGTPAANDLTRWPDEDRGRGTTPYTGGRLGLGIELSAPGCSESPELDEHYGDGSSRWHRMPHRHRYPKRPGEVLEAVMSGPCLVKPPIPWHEREWLYCPPASEI